MTNLLAEIKDPKVEIDILELDEKIKDFRKGTLNEDRFRSFRLSRGVYGQRQPGVQMVRFKLPFGKISSKQLITIADVAEEYSNGNLHLTTRQDVQIYFVSLDKTPELWVKLEQEDITLRGSCGNTVRNITASAIAGIDPKEPFDVSPYAQELFNCFLRTPFSQALGRKFKIAFSSNQDDDAFTFMHDLGFIPKVKIVDGKIVRGFKVLIGGGLGAQPFLAKTAFEFLEEDQIISFTEAVIRVYDRHGERFNRQRARIKYLVNKIGIEQLLKYVEEERLALTVKTIAINRESVSVKANSKNVSYTTFKISDNQKYKDWLTTNVFEQKQQGYYGVNIKLVLGNLVSEKARSLAEIVNNYAADDIRITINQGFLLKFVPKEALPALYKALDKLGFAEPGFNSVADITSCPGTATCALGITSSTGVAKELEKVIKEEYPELIYNSDIKIKISGCMNSCGQHSLAQIGFHGSSIKNGTATVPALQLVLGGGPVGNGEGRISEKIIKVPTKRAPNVLRTLFEDYEKNSEKVELFNTYYDKKGKDYFYRLLKSFGETNTLHADEYLDWGHTEEFKTQIGMGECAGVIVDLVDTLIFEAEEKINWAESAFNENLFADSIYHSYAAIIGIAKVLLIEKNIFTNTHIGIINDFEKHFVATSLIPIDGTFSEFVLQIKQNEPSKKFASKYLMDSREFLEKALRMRETKSFINTS